MDVLPPGTILQLMYLRERISGLKPGKFVEIGAGAGHISHLLLSLGWRGKAYDLSPTTAETLRNRFAGQIANGSYDVVVGDWLTAPTEPCDLVISCMVMEHFDDEGQRAFILHGRNCLTTDGAMITIVPGSPAHWGIEDEIAGHYRRYSRETATSVFDQEGMNMVHISGLTYPVSNMLFPLSNFIVKRNESKKLSLSMIDRTKQSGIRGVPMKTTFPKALGLLLNERVMFPLHIVQKAFGNSDKAMVLYCETKRSQI
ncbi:class I SAM-dependent methyltransferase [Pseudomonas sp. B21-054]|uniref:class I SAM-dependent methyltransferase n=1 Tax=Pseudomonas sp. B21-054 TaxID=2895494 RepID=UPI0022321D0B|nr:class I SAM-dependent methyltransferase [Pseudomonas sp. B21-054]UZE19619.1 class I SAM-dependent methyltransferase [Pseudomonas sp. B21-054]